MIAVLLLLIVTGSFLTSGVLFAQGASWGMIALGYVGGGWAALVIGILLALIWRGTTGGITMQPALATQD